MPFVVPSAQNQLLLTLNYDPTGLAWVDLFDNALVGWAVDEVEPQTFEPAPRAIGSLAPEAPDTGSTVSPHWALAMPNVDVVFVPDLYRGGLSEFLTWLATNGGASRKVGGQGLVYPNLHNGYESWARMNPGMVFKR
jgi:hypothetical protein